MIAGERGSHIRAQQATFLIDPQDIALSSATAPMQLGQARASEVSGVSLETESGKLQSVFSAECSTKVHNF
jgi:hypothetical protein